MREKARQNKMEFQSKNYLFLYLECEVKHRQLFRDLNPHTQSTIAEVIRDGMEK